MSSMDTTLMNISMNEDSISSLSKSSTTRRHHQQNFTQQQQRIVADERDKSSFYRDLYHYHETKGTPIPRSPRVNGQEIDLHKFYSIVCSRGGSNKVNYRNEWEDLVSEFDLPPKCVNASVALKQIYMRYLDRYEKIHFLGEDDSRNIDENDDDNRHKKWSNKIFNEVPLKYNYGQHYVSDTMRTQHKLSTDLYKASEFEKLLLSLMSPLPNEQDFAINVCTLMANESRHTLKIEHCPKLIDALMGHAGVFSHHSMRELFEQEFYSNIRKHSLQSFWTDCLSDKSEILELAYEDYFQSPSDKLGANAPSRPPIRLRTNNNENFEDGLNTRANELEEFTSLDFLNLRRGLGTQDYIGQRVHQITSICRNLSFFDENVTTLVRNRTFIRYLVMCSNIRWGNLHQMALDMLGNVASELDLWDPTTDDLTRCLLSTIADGLESQDRGVIISCLEILYKLCQRSSNEDYLHRCLNKKIYRQICMYLSLNDIMLLLYTLECLFSLSSLGEKSCLAIVQINGVIDTLMSLVSVEAQSYGPDGCILMRVVETVPQMAPITYHHQQHLNLTALQNSSHVQSQQQLQPNHQLQQSVPLQQHVTFVQPSSVPVNAAHSGPYSPAEPQKISTVTNQVPPSPIIIQNQSQTQLQQIPQLTQQQTIQSIRPATIVSNQSQSNISNLSTPVVATVGNPNVIYSEQQTPSVITSSPNSGPIKTAQQQINHENEQFALAWLRATFEPAVAGTSRIEQQDLYKMYLTACSKIGRTGHVPIVHYPRCVRNVFGPPVGPVTVKITKNNMETYAQYYEGIRIRAQPLAIVHKGTILQAAVTTTTAQTNEKKDINQGTIIKTAVPTIIQTQVSSSGTPILQQVLSNQNVSNENMVLVTQNRPNIIQVNATSSVVVHGNSQSTPITSTSLIKSLLANKVNADGTTTKNVSIASPNVASTAANNLNVPQQVAQRQHLQKQKELAAASESKTVVFKHGIHPISKANVIEKKMEDGIKPAWDPVPPLAPLSHSITRQTNIIASLPAATASSPKNDDDSNSTGLSTSSSVYGTNPTTLICNEDADGSFAGFEGLNIPGSNELKDDVIGGKPSQVVSNNKMLADLLERKSADPPFNITNETAPKRKIDAGNMTEGSEPANKRPVETVVIDDDDDSKDGLQKQNKSSDAANAYAKLAASLLEDEDMELDDTINQPQVTNTSQAVVEAPKSVITVPMQRQIIVSPNNPPQMILAPTNSNAQIGQATATIKTDSGYQTVPLILQHGTGNQGPTIQIQKPLGNIGQQIMQPVMQQPQTQYVLATNQQGQTYLLAQQQPQSVNQIVLTQSSQQQGGGPTKTIIILQQQAPGAGSQNSAHSIIGAQGTPQKVIMTTQQGQQMIVTQVPRPMQHHVIVNQHSLAATTCISSSPAITTTSAIMSGISSTQSQIVPQVQLHQTQAQITLPSANQSSMIQIQKTSTASSTPTINVQTKAIITEKKVVPEKKVFVTGSGNIEITEVQQMHTQNQSQAQSQSQSQQQMQTTPSIPNSAKTSIQVQSNAQSTQLVQNNLTPNIVKPVAPIKVDEDPEWPFICDWRGCQRKKFRSANEVYLHACAIHCPDSIDPNAEIYCQWGPGPNLCDNLPRKRFSLMTHMNDRHCTLDALRAAVQRRSTSVPQPNQPTQPVTIIKNPQVAAVSSENSTGSSSPSPSTSSTGSANAASSSAAMQAIKRHTIDMINSKELMDENEGPVTKSIRLTAALILRNLVNYTSTAKRCLRYYEPHLAAIALSNVESSRTISQVLFEMNETSPY